MVVWADYVLFRSKEKNVAMQNIGGIGDDLPSKPAGKAFWLSIRGPGNVLIDEACRTLFERKFDEDGEFRRKVL